MTTDTTHKKIVVAGDIIPTEKNIEYFVRGDIDGLFGEDIKQIFKLADFSIANLEGSLTDNEFIQDKVGPVIKAPTQCINAIRELNLSSLTLANNHITDAGEQGVRDTMRVLESSGILYSGIGTSENIKTHISTNIDNLRICFYTVSETFFNKPSNSSLGANLYNDYKVCNELRELRDSHDLIIVLYHGGSEYFQYPTPIVSERCHRMIDNGANIIVTQHTHCIGCEEYYNNGYILHGQGNFCFGNHKNPKRRQLTDYGLLLCIDIATDKKGSFHINKKAIKLHNNEKVRLCPEFDFSDFEERSKDVALGKDFRDKLVETKFEEIAFKYIRSFKGRNIYFNFLKHISPRLYKREVLKISKKQARLFFDILTHDRRNEEFSLIFEHLMKKD